MNTSPKPEDDIGGNSPPPRRRPPLLILLALILFVESAVLFVVVLWLVLQLMTGGASSIYGGIALVVLAVLAAGWVLAIAINTIRERSWIRAASVTWQVVQIAIAVGCFQGLYAQPVLGWVILVPSLVAIGLVLSPQVTAVTRRMPRGD